MGSLLLLWLLGAALTLPCAGALTCYLGTRVLTGQNKTQNLHSLATEKTITCKVGELCQETMLFIESGPRGMIVGSKGCTAAGITSSGPTNITGPGVTIVSYARVCYLDFCNGISSTEALLSPTVPAAPAPDGLQCPTCVQDSGSCSSSAHSLCPEGTSRCYQGTLQLNGGGIQSDVSIQGCAPRAITGCHLLSNIQAFGPISVKEVCQSQDQNLPNTVSVTTVQGWGMGAGLLLALWGCLPPL